MRLPSAVVLVVAVFVFAGCAGKGPSYPDKYLIKGDEMPSGLILSEIPEELGQFGISSNPAAVPAQLLAGLSPEFQGVAPDMVWVELLQKSSDSKESVTGGLMIAAAFWNDGKKVDTAVSAMKANDGAEICAEQEQGRALRDGNVVVVIGGDEEMSGFVNPIASVLQGKAPGLKSLC